jgi:hypothetical protein
MKCKSVLGALTIALSMSMATNVSAFGLPKIGGSDKPAATSSAETMDSVLAQQDSLVKTYQSSLGDILSSQALLLEAYGIKEDAAKLRAEADAIEKGPLNKAQLEKATSLSADANEQVNAKMDEEKALSDEARGKYQQALLPYATGVAEMAKLTPDFQSFLQSASDQVKNAPLMEKRKVKKQLDVGMYLAKAAPGYITNVTTTTKRVVTFAKRQGVSKQTTDNALEALSSL